MTKTPEEYFQEVNFSASGGSGGAFSAAELSFIRKYMGVDAPETLRKLGLEGKAEDLAQEPATPLPEQDSSRLETFISNIDEARPAADVPRSLAGADLLEPAPVPALEHEEEAVAAVLELEEIAETAEPAPVTPEAGASAVVEPPAEAVEAPEPAEIPEPAGSAAVEAVPVITAEAAAAAEAPAQPAVPATPALIVDEGEVLPPEPPPAPAPTPPVSPVPTAQPEPAPAPAAAPPAAEEPDYAAEPEEPKPAPTKEQPQPTLAEIYDGMDIQAALDHFLKHESELQMVAFYIGSQEFVVPTVIVQEVIHYSTPAKLPAAPPFVAGVINLRGKVTPLMHLRDVLEVKNAGATSDRFIIVCRFQGLQVGLIIDRVHSMYRVPQKDIDWGIEAHLGINVDYVSGLLKLGERLVGIVSVDKIVATLLVDEAV